MRKTVTYHGYDNQENNLKRGPWSAYARIQTGLHSGYSRPDRLNYSGEMIKSLFLIESSLSSLSSLSTIRHSAVIDHPGCKNRRCRWPLCRVFDVLQTKPVKPTYQSYS